VKVDLQNDSAVDVADCTVKLIRVIKLHGQDRSRGEKEKTAHTVLDTVIEMDHEGCSKNRSTTCQVVLDLGQFKEGIGIPPSTSGTLVKVYHHHCTCGFVSFPDSLQTGNKIRIFGKIEGEPPPAICVPNARGTLATAPLLNPHTFTHTRDTSPTPHTHVTSHTPIV